MFLGAGSVMHGMNDDVNMRHYGALARAMPITFVTFAAGYLAIIGFPFFSGFYSKDHIIEAAFERSAVVGAAGHAGRRHDGLLHDPADADDLLRPAALAARGTPARVAAGDDRAAGAARRRLGDQRAAAQQLDRRLAGSGGGRRARRGGAEPAALLADRRRHPGCRRRSVSAISVVRLRPAAGHPAAPRRQTRSPFILAGRNDLYGDAFNEAVFMRPGQQLTYGLRPAGGLRHRRHGQRHGVRSIGEISAVYAGCRTVSSAPTR